MEKDEIEALEPKYIGNTRHLTEGEAGEIMHDPANGEGDDNDALTTMARVALLAVNQEIGPNGNELR